VFRVALASVTGLVAAMALWVGGLVDSGPKSKPDSVSPSCGIATNARACAIALRYLAALDLFHDCDEEVLAGPEVVQQHPMAGTGCGRQVPQ